MGLWTTLKNVLFGSGGGGPDDGLYFYVRLYNVPNRQSPDDEIVKVRINSKNDISLSESGDYFVRKMIVGNRKFKRAEMTLYFDGRKSLKDSEIDNGELVNKAAYEAYMAQFEDQA